MRQLVKPYECYLIYGGAAGGGKTYAILMEPLRYINTKGYRAVIFRKNFNQIFASGGIWDESQEMYGDIAGAASMASCLVSNQ